MTALLSTLAGKIGAGLLIAALLGGGYAWITTAAFNRGHAAAQTEMEATLQRQEKALRDALRKNEALTDPELDCQLKRLRNPSAACP